MSPPEYVEEVPRGSRLAARGLNERVCTRGSARGGCAKGWVEECLTRVDSINIPGYGVIESRVNEGKKTQLIIPGYGVIESRVNRVKKTQRFFLSGF